MKLISDLILRAALLILVVPAVPVTDEIAGLFRHVTSSLEQIQLPRQ